MMALNLPSCFKSQNVRIIGMPDSLVFSIPTLYLHTECVLLFTNSYHCRTTCIKLESVTVSSSREGHPLTGPLPTLLQWSLQTLDPISSLQLSEHASLGRWLPPESPPMIWSTWLSFAWLSWGFDQQWWWRLALSEIPVVLYPDCVANWGLKTGSWTWE